MKKFIIQYDNIVLKVQTTKNNTHIKDSYKVKSLNDMRGILTLIRCEASDNAAVYKRRVKDMIHEWRVHNLLYSLGIKRDRTGSVDLNINQPWYIKVLYTILSPLYLHFN